MYFLQHFEKLRVLYISLGDPNTSAPPTIRVRAQTDFVLGITPKLLLVVRVVIPVPAEVLTVFSCI